MRKFWLYFLLGIGLLVVLWGFLRVFTPEDNWICSDGQWIEHGKPLQPMPLTPCPQ